jgi:hypothetical protein
MGVCVLDVGCRLEVRTEGPLLVACRRGSLLRDDRAGRVFGLTKELAAEELEALRAAGWLRPTDPVPTVPCDDAKRRCFRIVREADADAGAALPFVGVY